MRRKELEDKYRNIFKDIEFQSESDFYKKSKVIIKDILNNIHTHAELCKKNEIVYREKDLLLIVQVLLRCAHGKGFVKALNETLEIHI